MRLADEPGALLDVSVHPRAQHARVGKTNRMKRAAFYLRVSTLDRHPENHSSANLEQLAQQSGWEVVNEYRDHGIDGARARAPRAGSTAGGPRRGQQRNNPLPPEAKPQCSQNHNQQIDKTGCRQIAVQPERAIACKQHHG